MAIRKPIQDIGKQTTLYGIGNVLTKLAAFFLIPVYTKYLSITEVGILALLEMMEFFLIIVSPMGIIHAVWRFLPECKENDRSEIIITAYVGILTINIAILGIMAVNYSNWSGFFGLDATNARMFLLVLLNILFAVGIRFILYIWQYQKRVISYITLSSIQFFGILLVTIVFVVQNDLGLWGVLKAKAFVLGSIFIFTGFITILHNQTRPSMSVLKKLLGYGSPLILLSLITPIMTVSDRFFLKLFDISLVNIGIYSIAYKFGMIINMVLVIPLQRGWMPMMYKMGIEKESHDYYRDILFYYAVIGTFLFLGLSFFAKGIIEVVATPEYTAGVVYIPIVTLAYFVNGFRQFFMAGSALNNKTSLLGFASVIGIVINIILNYFLIMHFGVIGAAWATLGSYIILTIIIYIFSQKIVHINWAWSRLIKLIFLLITIFTSTFYFQTLYSDRVNIIGIIGIVLFLFFIRIFNVIGKREMNGVKSIFSSIIK